MGVADGHYLRPTVVSQLARTLRYPPCTKRLQADPDKGCGLQGEQTDMASELKPQRSNDLWAFPGFGRMIDDLLPTHWPARTDRALHPAMDVEEDGNQITIRTELPGIAKEDVKITLEDGVLSISGEKKSDREMKEKTFHLVERSFGAFHRSLTLPTGVDAQTPRPASRTACSSSRCRAARRPSPARSTSTRL